MYSDDPWERYLESRHGASELRPDWWKHYPSASDASDYRPEPEDGECPVFVVGDLVRLLDRPEIPRQVLAIEWHALRHEFAYIVETSAPQGFQPYWFAAQLDLYQGVTVPRYDSISQPTSATNTRGSAS